MEKEEAEVVHRPELTIKEILVTAIVPASPQWAPFKEKGWKENQFASFYVNTETWECKGEVSGLAMVDDEWWQQQCQRVSDRVRASITTLKV